MEIELKYGNGTLHASFPPNVDVQLIEPRKFTGCPDADEEVLRALENPINSPALSEIAANRKSAVVLISDATRPSPTALLLPHIVDELRKAGINEDSITVVVALGVHRRSTDEEKKRMLGPLYGRLECVDHDIEDCVSVARTTKGTEVEVFRLFADAELKIATGAVEYHYFAGYTGGAKSVLPGVCSPATINDNHRKMDDPLCLAGLNDGPVRSDMEEAAGLTGLDFILNVVLNESKKVVRAFSGHFIDAHRAACELVDEMYSVPAKPADIVVTCAVAPKDINLYQSMKALTNAGGIVKHGGTIILLGRCQEGVGDEVFERWLSEACSPDDVLSRLELSFELGCNAAVSVAKVMRYSDVVLVTDMPENMVERILMKKADSLQHAIDAALKLHGNGANVVVMPFGASTLPFQIETPINTS